MSATDRCYHLWWSRDSLDTIKYQFWQTGKPENFLRLFLPLHQPSQRQLSELSINLKGNSFHKIHHSRFRRIKVLLAKRVSILNACRLALVANLGLVLRGAGAIEERVPTQTKLQESCFIAKFNVAIVVLGFFPVRSITISVCWLHRRELSTHTHRSYNAERLETQINIFDKVNGIGHPVDRIYGYEEFSLRTRSIM